MEASMLDEVVRPWPSSFSSDSTSCSNASSSLHRFRRRITRYQKTALVNRSGASTVVLSSLVLLLLNILSSQSDSGAASNFFCHAKKVSGDFKLSGVHTEHILSSYAVRPAGSKLRTTFTAKVPYDRETGLRFRAYRDTEWPQFQKLTLCTEKVRLAKQTVPVNFKEVNGKWQAEVVIELPDLMSEGTADPLPRNHYWYFAIDDCSLEQYYRDNKIPDIHFELSIQNYMVNRYTKRRNKYRLTHLGGDAEPLVKGHVLTWMLSCAVCFRLLINIFRRLRDRHHSVHAAVLWVSVAATTDAWSSFMELLHLGMYHNNGIGLYFCDCVAAWTEAVTDTLLMLLLLSIAAGWTLPSSVLTVVTTNASPVQKILKGLAHPISEGIQNKTMYLAGGVLAWHLLLAQWGRVYQDDFDSYHDLEHWPGRILMWTRIGMGLLFAAAVLQTRTKFTGQLSKFYSTFSVIGFFWFMSLPVLTWLCGWAVPYHVRRPTVFVGAALLQSTSLVVLAWLVTTHSTAYHQVSRMTATNDTLSDSLDRASFVDHHHGGASPRASWRLGKKAKVALD